jgi:hypothetical protein
MEKRSTYTIRTLLEELKQKLPRFEKGQIFEILKSIYPDEKILKESRNIEFKGKIFTKPLALCRKDKMNLLKEGSDMVPFFKNYTRGDFVKVLETDSKTAICENLSINDKIRNRFYKDKDSLITLTFEDVANGTIKLFRRKVDKYLNK